MVKKFHELFENVQLAKSYLTKNNIPLDNEDFQIIKGMLSKNPGWVAVFTLFRFEDDAKVDDLAVLYDRLKELQPLLSRLPQPVDKYTSFEKLVDDLDKLQVSHLASKLVKELNRQQQSEFAGLTQAAKDKLTQVAPLFYKLPVDVQRAYWAKVRGVNGYNFPAHLSNYVQAHETGFSYEAVTQQAADAPGAKVVYANPEQGIIVVALSSFHAAGEMCGATLWCFRDNETHWQRYGGESTSNSQYAIYNFQEPLSSSYSMIGVTIKRVGSQGQAPIEQRFSQAHLKDDSPINVAELAKYYGANWQGVADHLLPISEDEFRGRAKNIRYPTDYSGFLRFKFNEGSISDMDEFMRRLRASYNELSEEKRETVEVIRGYERLQLQALSYLVYNSDDEELFLRHYAQLDEDVVDLERGEVTTGLFYYNATEQAQALVKRSLAYFLELHAQDAYRDRASEYLAAVAGQLVTLELTDAMRTLGKQGLFFPGALVTSDQEHIPVLRELLADKSMKFGAAAVNSLFIHSGAEGDSLFLDEDTVPIWKEIVTGVVAALDPEEADGLCSKAAVMITCFAYHPQLVGPVFDNQSVLKQNRYVSNPVEYLPEQQAWKVYWDNFHDPYFVELFKDENAFGDEDDFYDGEIPDFDFDDLWYDLDNESLAKLTELLRGRGYRIEDKQALRQALGKYASDDDDDDDDDDDSYDDDDDEYDYDEEEEVYESHGKGADLSDIMEALKNAWQYVYESDTQDAIFNAKIEPVLGVFKQVGDSFFSHHPLTKKDHLTLLLPVRYVYDNLSVEVMGELEFDDNDSFTLLEVVKAILSSDDELFDPSRDDDPTVTKETMNSYVRQELPAN